MRPPSLENGCIRRRELTVKKRLYQFFAATILMISVVLAGVVGSGIWRILNEIAATVQEDVMRQVNGRISDFDTILYWIEMNMEDSGMDSMRKLADRLPDPGELVSYSPNRLKELALSLDLDELYVIDRSCTVVATSFKPDEGFNLGSIGGRFRRFLQELIGSGRFATQRIVTSNQTGIINKYFYYGPPASDYLIETSLSVRSYFDRTYSAGFYEYLFQDFFSSISDRNRHVVSLGVYHLTDKSQWSLSDKDGPFEDRFGIADRIEKEEQILIESEGLLYHYSLVEPSLITKDFSYPLFVEIVYDISSFKLAIRRLLVRAAAAVLIFLLAATILLSQVMQSLFLKPFASLEESIRRIENGEIPQKRMVKQGDEFGAIEASIITMAERIEQRTGEIEETRNFFRNIINSMPSLIFILDSEGLIEGANDSALSLLGMQREEARGRKLTDLLPELSGLTGNVNSRNEQLVLQIARREKAALYQLSQYAVRGNHPQWVIRLDDVTDMKKKDEQVRQAQRMETIGNLAGGLAHDFNNILGGISGTISLMKLDLETEQEVGREEFLRHLSSIGESVSTAAELVGQMLTLAKNRSGESRLFDLNLVAERTIEILRNSADRSIGIDFFPFPGQAICEGSPSQIDQLLLNLGINGIHAMTTMRDKDEKYGGTLSLAINRPENRNGRYWTVTVRDTGVGIPETIQQKIYDPFFSTKTRSRGTGLGLTMVYNIVRQHNGLIELQSYPEKGSTFTILLPVPEAVLHGDAGKLHYEEPGQQLVKGSGTILFVDDEALLRNTGTAMLKACGYQVVEADSGEAALERLEKEPERFNLIILDMVMRGMSGLSAFRIMKKHYPDIPVILSSGNSEDDRIVQGLEAGAAGFLGKPYTLEEMSRQVADIIGLD